MTRVMVSAEDLSLMRDFLEETRLAFLTVPFGASMEGVNSFFWQWTSTARRRLPANVWVVVRVRGHYRRSVRLQRWSQRQLLALREAAVAMCVLVVTGSAEI
jgi:hypothetical protein